MYFILIPDLYIVKFFMDQFKGINAGKVEGKTYNFV